MDPSLRSAHIIRFGPFELDPQAGELHKQGQKVRLQEQPLQILLLLLQRPGEVVTREELRQKLWPGDTFVDFEAGLNTAVKKLRDALDDSADRPRFVETLPRRGYRFIGPVADSIPLPRRRLGRYWVEEKVGAGGMGEVYRGRDDHLERDVALKVLPAGVLADEAARKRFRKEALALSKLNHPNIETVYDFGTQEGVDYLVLEYVPGVTLDDKLAAGPLGEKEVLTLATQLGEALAAAHGQAVLHRDLKPKNLRVTPDGRLKVLDFGLAKLLGSPTDDAATSSVSETQGLVGTLPYMAPEQLRGEKADARTDLYAAGLVLYEMATGQRAFREDLAPRLTDAILHQALVLPRALNPRISPELERVIVKCLEKEPENRYQSARELGADLRRLGGLVTAPVAGAASPRVRLRRAMVAASLVVVTLAAIGMVYRLTRPPALPFEERDWVLIAQFENRTGEEVLSGALEYALERELSNSRFVNVVPRERIADALQLMKKPLDTTVDAQVGREVCLRDGGIRALLTGRVEKLDSSYLLSVALVN
ncbi:MAG: protein kinase domain-containing protein, partial [Candidatus Acidiferrales bacterium]